MTKSKKQKPDLKFIPGGKQEGFTTSDVATYDNLNPNAVVRELIQNALDAVREDNRDETIVRFEVKKIKLADLPGIESYKTAFLEAKKFHKINTSNQSGQTGKIIQKFEKCLQCKEIEVLSVLDNGIGLDSHRMNRLLADGLTGKDESALGAFGNGHFTAIPASDLQYVLYGGLNSGKRIASGHAILASHKKKSKDGLFIKEFGDDANDVDDDPYLYVTDDGIPNLINDRLNWIEAEFESKTGSAIIIPAFNRFRKNEENLWEIIEDAVACNFFLAITEGQLKVIYKDKDTERVLDESNIGKVFEQRISQRKRRRKKIDFIAGERAAEAYETAIHGNREPLDVGCGKVELRWRYLNDGTGLVDLCRNGMWIADRSDLPRFQGRFSDRRPFHCLIVVITQANNEIHDLINLSEGPLHVTLDRMDSLEENKKNTLKDAFEKIAKYLEENLEKSNQKISDIEGFLTIGGTRKINNYNPMPKRPNRSTASGGEEKGGGGHKGKKGQGGGKDGGNEGAFKKSGNPVTFQALPKVTGPRSRQIYLRPVENLKSGETAEIRFLLDEGFDETCDRTNAEQYVRLANIKLDGSKAPEEKLVKQDGNVLAVRLPQFEEGQELKIDFDFELPSDVIPPSDDEMIILNINIVRRRDEQKE